jgi:trigger factor
MSLIQNFVIKDNHAHFDVVLENDIYLALVTQYEAEYLKNIKVDGFRPGQVPKEVAIKHINPMAFEEFIVDKIVNANTQEVINELEPILKDHDRHALDLNFDSAEDKGVRKDDKDSFVYSLKAKLLTKVNLKAITDLKKPVVSTDDFTSLEEYKAQQVSGFLKDLNEFDQSSNPIKLGDKVTVKFEGSQDGVSKPELQSEGYTVMIGNKEFLEDFENNMIGLKINDQKTFNLTFPADYFAQEMAGKTVEFKIEIKEVMVPKFATLEELVAGSDKVKEQFKSLEEINSYIESRYQAELTSHTNQKVRSQLTQFLIKETEDVELNNQEVELQTDHIFNSILKDAKEAGTSVNEMFIKSGLKSDRKDFANLDSLLVRAEIEKNIREEFKIQSILLAVVFEQKIPMPQKEEIDPYIDQIVQYPTMFGYPEGLKKEEYTNMVVDRMLKSKAFDWLVENMQ